MPHDPHDDPRTREERAAERVLGALEASRLPGAAGAVDAGAGEPDGPDELLGRLYTELLGVVPLALDERPPAPGLRQRVLAAASDEATLDAVATRGGEVEDGAAGLEDRRAAAAFPPAAPPRAVVPHRLAAAAAALALALVGLGVFAGWLHGRLDVQERTIADLRSSLEETERRADALAAAQDDLERRRLDLASQLALVSTPGVEVCPLRPVGETAEDDALGLLFLSNAQREWYVRVARLDPPPEGRVYVLWFQMDGDRYVSAGRLEPGAGETIGLSGTEMPTPDEMTGAAVTLERAGPPPDRPAGPVVLFGDERIGMV